MQIPKKLGVSLLGVWLIVFGAIDLIPALSFQGIGTLLALLAIIAGVLILLDR